MGYLGTKPANAPITSEQLPDGVVQSSDISSGAVTQAKLATPVAGTGPAFSAYLGSNQTVSSGVNTKVQINTEEFDTANAFDSTTNYRFTPLVAGYYQVNANAALTAVTATYYQLYIYKNGSNFKQGPITSAAGTYSNSVNALVYLNGSTDYIELYGYAIGATTVFVSGSSGTYFQASMVRGA